MKTKIQELADFGQSIWLDYISRSLLETGGLQDRINCGIRGLTSNPTIFHQAISAGHDYDKDIMRLCEEGKMPFGIYDLLTVRDIQDAAGCFMSVYEKSERQDGYVSLEINPHLAMDPAASLDEARRLWSEVDRPNLMIKVPATDAGFPVVEELISEGKNVNVTLIFSSEQYRHAARAYLNGLKRLAKKSGDLSQVRSVASVFVSRIDTAVDKRIEEKLSRLSNKDQERRLESLKGKAAVANCRIVFEEFRRFFENHEFKILSDMGACVQRVLWASTGTKNPQYSDIKYVTELISRQTVNTLPEKTIQAFLEHGVIREGFIDNAREAQETLDVLGEFGVDIHEICLQLLSSGVTAFEEAFDALLHSIEVKSKSLFPAS